MTRPRLLDVFCCQGGASKGYADAGFDVVGVDIDPQPRYPFEFHRGDAVDFIKEHGHEFDALAGSPPCQRYSATQRIMRNEHPDLIAPTRDAMFATGLPYVIENVDDARPELIDPVRLCGPMFGLRTYRHRLFELSRDVLSQVSASVPLHHPHRVHSVKMGRPLAEGDFYHAVGNFSNVPYVRADLGVPWMSREGIRECIPPAYAEFIGRHLINAISERSAA